MIPKRYFRFARIGMQLAEENNHKGYQLCAIVVKRNKMLAIGYNSFKTHPVSAATRMQYLHAEMDAVVRCDKSDLVGADIIVVRRKPSGKPGLAKPCIICANLLDKLPIRNIYYTVNGDRLTLERV